jgi:uncharacterized protein YjbI with pentapeptide repeats
MKASEVLNRYIAGERNFQRLNLRGQSFKGKDLSGADFSEADIRSTNFTGANLRGANFTGAKCGLQKCWMILSLNFCWLLAGVSGVFSVFSSSLVSVFTDSVQILSVQKYFVENWMVLILFIFFLIVIILRGIPSGVLYVITAAIVIAIVTAVITTSLPVLGAGSIAVAAVVAITVATITAAVAAATAFISAAAVAVGGETAFISAVAVAAGGALTVIKKYAIATASPGDIQSQMMDALATAVPVGFTIVVAFAGAYISQRAMRGDPRDAWVRSFAIAFAAIGGTSFRSADLSHANFTGAKLKSTDFRKANLTRVRWYGAKILDRVRPGDTYLKNISLRQLLITGNGQNQDFDRQDLRGVNLQEANLTNASFIDTDLSQANLQEATLFEAKLVQTNLDKANLSKANLTGAYIEDWGITRNTIFEGVKGDYVYQKLPTKYNRDPNRMPPSEQGNFGENDLYIFITSVLDTLDLYHRQNINAGVAITVLKGLTEDYPVQFELAGIEKRGDSQYVMKLKVFGQASHFQLQREYYARYEQTLPLYDPKMLMPDSENIVAEIIKTVKENPGTHIENLHNQGIFITGGKVNMLGDRNIKINKGNYNENIKGDYMEGNSYSITGDNNQAVQGDNNQTTQQNQADTDTREQITQAEVIKLLAELSQKIVSSELPEETKQKILNRLVNVSDDVQEKEPDKELVTGNLKKVTETLAQASKSTEEAKKLWDNVQPILETVGKWLGVAIQFF